MKDIQPIVMDLETTMNCPVGNNKANPFWPGNDIVMLGSTPTLIKGDPHTIAGEHMRKGLTPTSTCMLVGHNIAFDLHYLMQRGHYTSSAISNIRIWDTQLAEYLLSGQTKPYPSLDETALSYGGTVKDSRVSDIFKSGKGAEHVPKNMLEEYLKADLENTSLVFLNQVDRAETEGMMPLLMSQMEARQATIEMTYNGLAVDKDMLESNITKLTAELAVLHTLLQVDGLDLTSPIQLSKWLFGGTEVMTERVADGFYKNGNFKFKTVTTDVSIPMRVVAKPEWKGANGNYSTADEVLQEIAGSIKPPVEVWPAINSVLLYRKKKKELTTYYEGIHKLIMPDGRIHHSLNHCVTRTGRLSSSDPNLQNVTGESSDIKKAFVSRWGEDGVILEADYSQLEIIVLAELSGDDQLIEDIKTGTDIHTALYKDMHGKAPTKAQRKAFKPCVFALIYGAGATGVAKQGKIGKMEAKKFIDTFYARYPGVKRWHAELADIVVSKNRYSTADKDKEVGLPIGRSFYISPISMRKYAFREYHRTSFYAKVGTEMAFSPTEIKNYPVQGTATGDIVPLVLGKLYRVLKNHRVLNDTCLMVNTVHDSIVFDVRKDVLPMAIQVIKETMERAPEFIKGTFGYTFGLPLKVGISYGPTWGEQAEIDNI